MLAPEVWNLSPPTSRETVLHNFDQIKTTVGSQYFTHSVLLVVPDSIHIPEPVASILSTDTDYYQVSQVPVTELLNRQFIDLFVRNGALTLHSTNTRLDLDNSIAINPNGFMIISLNKETFYKCGLEGTLSEFANNKFVVELDLKSDLFVHGSKRLKRIMKQLETVPELKFDVICAWETNDTDICPSSLAAWFSNASYHVECCSNEFKRETHFNLEFPDHTNDIHELIEWATMVHLECTLSPNPGLSSYRTPEPSSALGNMLTAQWTGMLTSTRVREALTKLETWVSGRETNAWVMLSVVGMADSVTSFGREEHHFYVEGDYSTSVILHRSRPPVALVHLSSCKAPKGRKRKRQERIK